MNYEGWLSENGFEECGRYPEHGFVLVRKPPTTGVRQFVVVVYLNRPEDMHTATKLLNNPPADKGALP